MKVRVCGSPKRDITREENALEAKQDQETSAEVAAAIPPPPEPQNQLGIKRKADGLFQVKYLFFR
jgi:hypothetical protein